MKKSIARGLRAAARRLDKTPAVPKRPDRLSLKVVVSGAPFDIAVAAHDRIADLIREALKRGAIPHSDIVDWQLRTAEGTLLANEARIGEAGVVEGSTLFLDPEAGGGGNVSILAGAAAR